MTGLFEQKVCVVTGGGSGIGRATAELLADRGAGVVVADLSEGPGGTSASIARFVATDVTSDDAMRRLFDLVMGEFGRLDVLVNDAGVIREEEIASISRENFDFHMDVNAYGCVLGMKNAALHMVDGGAIVNVSSMGANVGIGGYGSHAASKAAVVALTRVAALELGERGIRVNCVCPGSVETPMLQAQEHGADERLITELAAPLLSRGRVFDATDIAKAIAFLASADASAIGGQTLTVDGGMTAGYSRALIEALTVGPSQREASGIL